MPRKCSGSTERESWSRIFTDYGIVRHEKHFVDNMFINGIIKKTIKEFLYAAVFTKENATNLPKFLKKVNKTLHVGYGQELSVWWIWKFLV